MKYRNIASALLFSALSFYSINAAVAQTSGIPSPIDGQPITDGPTSFNLGFEDDDRIPMRSNAFPWSAIGRVQIDNGGHCTGALIGRDLVLTNAHCIWVEGQRRGITFAPNYRNGQSPETVRGIPYRWGTDNPNKNRRADWAIIRLERPIGDRYGWFGYQSLNYQQLQGRTVTYAGYSTFGDEERQEFINGETAQVHIGCRVRDVFANDGVIHTDCDNGRGGSGGPIFIWQNKQPIIVGINAAEYRGESKVSFFTQNYTPGEGNVGVPTLTFSEDILQARSIPASNQPDMPSDISVSLGNGKVINYFESNGTGTLARQDSGEILQRYSGWHTSWDQIVAIRTDMVLFYDREAGKGEIYRIEPQGNLTFLYRYDGWRKTWSNISSLGNSRVRFVDDNNHSEIYSVNDDGVFFDAN